MSLLDVGGALGVQAAFLAAVHSLHATVFEVPFTLECGNILRSPFRINFFWNRIPVPSRSHDAVSFMNVLHHAATQTVPLLRQAAEIARRYILITEDLDVVSNREALREHDVQGIFRSDDEWKQLFARELPEFVLRQTRPLLNRRSCIAGMRTPHAPTDYQGAAPSLVCEGKKPSAWVMSFYVLERRES